MYIGHGCPEINIAQSTLNIVLRSGFEDVQWLERLSRCLIQNYLHVNIEICTNLIYIYIRNKS